MDLSKTKFVYILKGQRGWYEDWEEYIIATFDTEQAAQRACGTLNVKLKELLAKANEVNYNEIVEKLDIKSLDPHFRAYGYYDVQTYGHYLVETKKVRFKPIK